MTLVTTNSLLYFPVFKQAYLITKTQSSKSTNSSVLVFNLSQSISPHLHCANCMIHLLCSCCLIHLLCLQNQLCEANNNNEIFKHCANLNKHNVLILKTLTLTINVVSPVLIFVCTPTLMVLLFFLRLLVLAMLLFINDTSTILQTTLVLEARCRAQNHAIHQISMKQDHKINHAIT